MRLYLLTIAAAASLFGADAAISADEVKALPGMYRTPVMRIEVPLHFTYIIWCPLDLAKLQQSVAWT